VLVQGPPESPVVHIIGDVAIYKVPFFLVACLPYTENVAVMHQLPQELISHIATFLERDDDQSQIPLGYRVRSPSKFPPYATISRMWQYAIGRLTFQEISLKSTELPYFADTFVGHRRPFLSTLVYEIILPTYDDAKCAKFENENDKRLND